MLTRHSSKGSQQLTHNRTAQDTQRLKRNNVSAKVTCSWKNSPLHRTNFNYKLKEWKWDVGQIYCFIVFDPSAIILHNMVSNQTKMWTAPYCCNIRMFHSAIQDSLDGRKTMPNSTSHGSFGVLALYNRHSYTPSVSRSPQHFHRPGERSTIHKKDKSPLSSLA